MHDFKNWVNFNICTVRKCFDKLNRKKIFQQSPIGTPIGSVKQLSFMGRGEGEKVF